MSDQVQVQESIYQLVSFIIDDEEYGIDILIVQEIIRTMKMSRVPNSAKFIEGVINLRGKIVPVVDLRKRFGLNEKERDKDSRIVVVEINGKVVGFLVDKVREVLRVEKEIIDPPPELAMSIHARYLTGVAKLEDRMLILLDLEKVLMSDELEKISS